MSLAHGATVRSRIFPEKNAEARAQGGHVFLVQIELPEGEPLPEPGAPIPLSCYTVYSSWSGRYTLQQWMESRPELIQMPESSFDLWLAALNALVNKTCWSPEVEDLVTFLFAAEHE